MCFLESEEDGRALALIAEELGASIALSFEAVTRETPPKEIALLLLRLAMAEDVAKSANGRCA